ncbi:hypothetical protein LshimejAT787_0101690 [Lyophyllum shimeji]|uniref:Extracellular membrane protein CFEM domain-containing protein n=1 Tax=Lyophyllum shimeji TaxID=47721 RepID=A0A9P3PCC8_LYOSH|nr:hypothetical protein LshimejAT787_0101690 [Lyophyllum shimeji]
MVALLHVLSAALVLASSALANPAASETLHGLLKRQVQGLDPSKIPSKCQTDCNAVTNSVSGCTDISCLCKDSVVQAMGKCLSCGVSLKDSGLDVNTAQNVIDQMVSSCNSAGSPVQSVKVSASGSGNGAMRAGAVSAGAIAVVAFGAIVTMA